jgi:hypothetical protein
VLAKVKFSATGTDKFIRISDNFAPGAEPKSGFQTVGGAQPLEVKVSTQPGTTNGDVKVEVARIEDKYAVHTESMPVDDGTTYPIDDTNLPAAKSAA